MTGSNFLEGLKPDDILRRSLERQKAGDLTEAVFWAASATQVAGGPSFFESHALAAALLCRVGQTEAALSHWDKLAVSAPQRLQWLEPALRLAMRTTTSAGARYLRRWRQLLGQVYTETPSAQILAELEQNGVACVGCIGIHAGQLRGWAWLKRGEIPRLQILDLPPGYKFQITLKAVAGDSDHVLYHVCENLPLLPFRIFLQQADGKHIPGSPLLCSPPASGVAPKGKGRSRDITIIIPAYDDAEATLSCIGSVLASLKFNTCKPALLVAWDQGPNENLLLRLRRLAERGKITLVENPCNMGFLASVNHAMAQVSQGDVLLLNADTLVHGDWVDRFRAAADSRPDAGSITALGNEAELMSYPSYHDRGKVSRLAQVAILDSAAATLAPGEAVQEIPVGVGFCMLISREALRRIGGLDGHNIFRGYGEETYYCLRARDAGLRNYGLFNVFVGHLGERSFGLGKKALAAQNNLVIHEQYPGYRREYEIFLFHNKPKQLRRQIALNTLSRLPALERLEVRPWSSRILPPWARDSQHKPDRHGAAIFFRPGPNGRAMLRVWSEIPVPELFFQLPGDLAKLQGALKALPYEQLALCATSGAVEDFASQCGLDMATATRMESGPVLPPLRDVPEVILMAPPRSLHSYRQLMRMAERWPQTVFYIFHWLTLWPNSPEGGNLREMPGMDDYSPLGAGAFLMLDNFCDTDGWRAWLTSHHCGELPVYHGMGAGDD